MCSTPCFSLLIIYVGKEGDGMLDAVIVGTVIKSYREKKGLSQEVVSGFADIGRTHLSAIERGERKPTLETFYKICKAMEIKSSELLQTIEDEMKRNGTDV